MECSVTLIKNQYTKWKQQNDLSFLIGNFIMKNENGKISGTYYFDAKSFLIKNKCELLL